MRVVGRRGLYREIVGGARAKDGSIPAWGPIGGRNPQFCSIKEADVTWVKAKGKGGGK